MSPIRLSPPAPTRLRRPASRLSAAALAAATPPDRDRIVDLVRVAAVAVVVLGHWLMAAVSWDERGLEADNVLALAPWAQWLTWPLQVMPLVFLAGGAANGASWASASRRGTGYPAWLRGRLIRLVRPAAALVVAWTAGLAVASAAGVGPGPAGTAARFVAMPLWFLAVYTAVVAATPVTVAAHGRWGLRATAVLLGLAVLSDVAAAAGADGVAWTSFAWVWLLAHDLGLWWRRAGRRPGRPPGCWPPPGSPPSWP